MSERERGDERRVGFVRRDIVFEFILSVMLLVILNLKGDEEKR